jgi:hypothetical protein
MALVFDQEGESSMGFSQLTQAQMLERCDLAGVARVVSVGRATPDSPNLARLAFLRVEKGEPRESDGIVEVRLHGGGGYAAWSDWWDYPVGAVVRTHLDWNGAEEVYLTTWPGAVREVSERAEVA